MKRGKVAGSHIYNWIMYSIQKKCFRTTSTIPLILLQLFRLTFLLLFKTGGGSIFSILFDMDWICIVITLRGVNTVRRILKPNESRDWISKLSFIFSSNRDTMLKKSPPPPNLLQHLVVLLCIGIDLIMHGNLIEDIITEDSPFQNEVNHQSTINRLLCRLSLWFIISRTGERI